MSRLYTLHRRAAPAIDYAAELNPQQLAAVTAPPGPALVIAGAGSGKTRALTYRVAYLLEGGTAPENILLLTFTNKAAREMLARVDALLPDRTSGLWGGTFHSIGNRILRRHAEAAGYRPGFSILDREDQLDLLKAVLPPNLPKDFPKAEVVADMISFALNTGLAIPAVIEKKYGYFAGYEEEIARIRDAYEARKRTANGVDFDDLLEKPLRLLEREETIARQYRERFRFILVDEYQDTNRLQADFIEILAREHRNVMAVGDDAQSIYSWRGADYRNMLQFPERYPGARIFRIETNYRSLPEVLDVANAAIAANTHQFEKALRPVRQGGGMRPALAALATPQEQALFVAQRARELQEEGIALDEMAVLYRAHFHSMELQMELMRQGVPFRITSGLRFFEQAHVKDVAAVMKFVVNPHDEVAFRRMVLLLPGIGKQTAMRLWNAVAGRVADAGGGAPVLGALLDGLKVPAKAAGAWRQLGHTLAELAPEGTPAPPGKMLFSIMEAFYDDYLRGKYPNYESRREDLNTLAQFAKEYEEPGDFLDQLALLGGGEEEPVHAADGKLTLSSVHQAKGLEWRVVFVIGMAEGMFPSGRAMEEDDAVEEERRLFYVAVTRARDQLYLTYPLLRVSAGYGAMNQQPSRFLGEIPGACLETWRIGGGDPF